MSQKNQKQLSVKIKLVKSTIGKTPVQRACVRGLGLKKLHQTVIVKDDAEHRGMISKVRFMLQIEGES